MMNSGPISWYANNNNFLYLNGRSMDENHDILANVVYQMKNRVDTSKDF